MRNICAESFSAPLQWLARLDFSWWNDSAELRELEIATGGPWWLVGGAAFLMFVAWTACYAVSFRQAKRDASYAFPIANVALNFGWETVFAFALVGPLPRFYFPLQWGHLLWLGFDSVNVYQILKNGRAVQGSPFTRRWFLPIIIGTFALAGPAPYFFITYTGDIMGVNSAMIIDVVMAALFISLFANRLDLRGLSIWGGVFRFVGDTSSFVFLYLWWPAQFDSDRAFATCQVPAYAGIMEPRSYVFLYGMYAAATVLDAIYVLLLINRRRQLREAGSPVLRAAQGNTPAL